METIVQCPLPPNNLKPILTPTTPPGSPIKVSADLSY